MRYEVYVKPERGPSVVQERDEKNDWAWTTKKKAIQVADRKKVLYPHVDFIVHEVEDFCDGGPVREVVYDTAENHGK